MEATVLTLPGAAAPIASTLERAPFIKGVYVSGDELERAEARSRYEVVCQHPNEVGILGPDDCLVMDLDCVLFCDRDCAKSVVTAAAHAGVQVFIHTRNPDEPVAKELLEEPGIIHGQTHSALLADQLGSYVSSQVNPTLTGETHEHDRVAEATATHLACAIPADPGGSRSPGKDGP